MAADFNNGGLTRQQIEELQRYYGATADGLWGKNSTAAAGGLSAQQAWQQYQQGGGYSGGTVGSYGNNGYNNEGLTTDQIAEMQRYYGTTADGLWGKNSAATAGGLSAQQAWQQYQQQARQDAASGIMGFDDFYDRMGGSGYERKLRETINASVQQAVSDYEAQQQQMEQETAEMARQAYIAKMLGQKNLDQQMAAAGYAGGAAESIMLENELNYQNQLAEIERQRQQTLNEIQRAIENARLTGDMQASEMLAAYLQQVQNDYAGYYDQALAQQMQQQRIYTPGDQPPEEPPAEVTAAARLSSSAALTQASAASGGSSAQTIRNLQAMYNNGQITERQLIDLSYAVANPGK